VPVNTGIHPLISPWKKGATPRPFLTLGVVTGAD